MILMVRCKVQAEAFVLMGKNLTCSVKHKVLSKSDLVDAWEQLRKEGL